MNATDVSLTWKMTRTDKGIRVSYHIENHSKQRLHVCDGIVVSDKPGVYTQAATVAVEETSPTTALIKVSPPSGDVPAAVVPPGFYVPVEPGQSLDRTRDVALPLRRWDAMGREIQLSKKITSASLLVVSFLGEPHSWSELPGEGGRPIKVPENFSPLNLTAPAQPIP